MTTVDFIRVRRIVEAVHDLSPDERRAALDRECAGDRSLRREVEELLGAASATPSFLAHSDAGPQIAEIASTLFPDLSIGSRIGAFRLVRRLASGGMGTVWEAEQDSPRRTVALKTMRFADRSRESVRRFRHESEILARLRHPNIAQVIASGIHALPDGESLPWYALEFVEGARSLVEHVRERGLALRARLELFAILCDAVQHGHERGVIHRDLKPSNVLVDRAGAVKVIDFGVAHVREPGAELSSFHTEVGRVIGTLQYMAPEQVSGAADGADTRSDVYALGAILYELATDQLPYDLARLSLAEAARVLTEQVPPRPSARVRALSADLDAIVLKALEKDRDRRYPSAASLAADVRRHLRGEPIEARAPSVGYQLRLFARRNRALVGASALVLSTLIVATIVSIRYAWRAGRAEQGALQSATQARASADEALAQRDEARFREYTADIAAAYGALRAQDVSTAQVRLQACPQELRGFEWWYLQRRLDRSLWSRVVPAEVRAIHWLPGRERFLVITFDTRITWVQIRDGSTGDLIARGEPISTLLRRTLLTPDGSTLLGSSPDGMLRAYAVDTLCETGQWKVGSVAAHLDLDRTKTILATTDGAQIRLWAWPAMTPLREPFALKWPASALSFSPSGEWLAVALTSPTVDELQSWHLPSGELVATSSAHANEISDVEFSPDGTLLASCSFDHDIRLWDVPDLAPRNVLYGHDGAVYDVEFDPDGARLASAGWDQTLRVWDVAGAKQVAAMVGHARCLRAIAWSLDGRRLVSGDDARTIRSWDPSSAVDALRRPGRWYWRLAFWPDGRRFLAIHNELAESFSLRPLEFEFAFGGGARIWSDGAPSPDGQVVALGATTGEIVLWSSDGRERITSTTLDEGTSVSALAWSPDGARLAAASGRGRVRIFDRSLAVAASPADDRELLSCVAYSPSGAELLVAGQSGRLRLVDALDGSTLGESPALRSDVRAAAWSPDGLRIAAGLGDSRIVVWNVAEGRLERELLGHTAGVDGLSFTPDGRRLVSASHDRCVRLWDVASGREVAAFSDHTHWIYGLGMSPDGSCFVTGSADATLRTWDAGSVAEQLVASLRDTAPLARTAREAILASPDLDATLREQALELASRLPDDPDEVGLAAWQLANASPVTCGRALQLAELALRYPTGSSIASHAAALACARTGRASEALQIVDALLAEDPNDRTASTLRAMALVRLDRRDEALVELRAVERAYGISGERTDTATRNLHSEIQRDLGLR